MRMGPKNLEISFTSDHLTRYGGVYLLARFVRKLDVKRRLVRELRLTRRNHRYSVSEELLALLYPMMLGIQRIEATQLLKRNGVFQYLTGLPDYPNPTTVRRFLIQFASRLTPRLNRLHDRLLLPMTLQPSPPDRLIFDLDSTVLTVYGHQEGAAVGYNPTKRGRPSYHPLLCFEGVTKDCWHGELRSGDTHTGAGAEAMLESIFARVPASVKNVLVRADKGFYSHSVVERLETERAQFIIPARITQPIRRRLGGLRYHALGYGVQAAEFRYQPTHWAWPHRFVVIRRSIPEDPSEQLKLLTVGHYAYQVLVTNLKVQPQTVWRRYNQRAAVELIIKELKADYPLAKIPTANFAANQAYFHLLLFAYNLINWFKRLCLPQAYHPLTLKTLIQQILCTPGELVRVANRPVFKLPANFPHQDAWAYALRRIDKLKI